MTRTILAASLIGLAFAGPALATDIPGEEEGGRFIFKRVEDGFIRLDTRTGQVSLCSRHSVGWRCQTVPDERAALEAEIARLEGENATLKKELLTRGLDLPSGSRPGKPAPPEGRRDLKGPGDADLDRVMSFLEKAWRQLVEMVTNLQRRS
jgi:hypothetical protein